MRHSLPCPPKPKLLRSDKAPVSPTSIVRSLGVIVSAVAVPDSVTVTPDEALLPATSRAAPSEVQSLRIVSPSVAEYERGHVEQCWNHDGNIDDAENEAHRVRRRPNSLNQAALAWAYYCASNSAGGMSPIGPSKRRLLNQSTHTSVANSTASSDRHGPFR